MNINEARIDGTHLLTVTR